MHMNRVQMIRGLMLLALALGAAQTSWAAPPPCKGNKADPSCEEPTDPPAEPAAAAAVDSVTAGHREPHR
jgi:hypothetical protein